MNRIAVSALALSLLGTAASAADDNPVYIDHAGSPAPVYKVDVTMISDGQVERHLTATTRTGEAVPITSTRQIDYIKSITAGERGTFVETATLNLGMSAQFTVRPTTDGRIAVHYALGHATLNSLTNVGVTGHEIQLPDLSQDWAEQDAIIPNGGHIDGRFSDDKDVTYTITVSQI